MTKSSCSSLLPGSAPAPLSFCRLNEQSLHIVPANDVHECVDVARGLGTEVHLIGMLVHIEREDWRAARQCVAMVGRPLIDELAIARRPRQQHPSRAAAERLAHRDEFP